MSSKKVHPPLNPAVKGQPRFSRVLLIHGNELDNFINEALLNEITLSKEIRRESSPTKVLAQLNSVKRLSEVPELIFLDLNLESKEGKSFLDEFKKLSDFIRNKCKIIVVGSPEKREDTYRALKNPSVICYLMRPLDIFQVKEFIHA